MKGPLAVERAELLQMVKRLAEVAGRLRDVNAGVSREDFDEIQLLLERVKNSEAPRPDEWQRWRGLAMEFLAKLAVELLVKALS